MKPSCLTFPPLTPTIANPRQQRRGHPYSPRPSNRQYPSDYLEQLPIDYLVRSQRRENTDLRGHHHDSHVSIRSRRNVAGRILGN